MPPGASLRVFAMYAAGCGRGAPLRGPRRVAFPGATLARHEILVLRFEESPQKIRVHGGEPPATPDSRQHESLSPRRPSKAVEDRVATILRASTSLRTRAEGGGGGGALLGPVSSGEILRSPKPASRGGPEWKSGMRLSVVPGGHLPHPRPGNRSRRTTRGTCSRWGGASLCRRRAG